MFDLLFTVLYVPFFTADYDDDDVDNGDDDDVHRLNLDPKTFQLSDLLFIVLCVPFTAADYALTSVWPFGDLWCSLVRSIIMMIVTIIILKHKDYHHLDHCYNHYHYNFLVDLLVDGEMIKFKCLGIVSISN